MEHTHTEYNILQVFEIYIRKYQHTTDKFFLHYQSVNSMFVFRHKEQHDTSETPFSIYQEKDLTKIGLMLLEIISKDVKEIVVSTAKIVDPYKTIQNYIQGFNDSKPAEIIFNQETNKFSFRFNGFLYKNLSDLEQLEQIIC